MLLSYQIEKQTAFTLLYKRYSTVLIGCYSHMTLLMSLQHDISYIYHMHIMLSLLSSTAQYLYMGITDLVYFEENCAWLCSDGRCIPYNITLINTNSSCQKSPLFPSGRYYVLYRPIGYVWVDCELHDTCYTDSS